MKMLLTGVSGFVGSRLLAAVCNRYGDKNVIALSSKPVKLCEYILYNNDYSISKHDVCKVKDVSLIIHAGAFTPKSRLDADNILYCDSNIRFTEQLLTLMNGTKLQKIIYLSTLDVYDDDGIISELTKLNPSSLYGMSKLYCEKMVTSFSHSRNIKSQILRIGHVYGPGEEKYQKLLPIAISKILSDDEIELWGDGSEIRSFIYITDVIEACMAAIDLTENVGVINIVSEQSISIVSLLNKLAEILNTELKLISKPSSGENKDYIFDSSKMKQVLLVSETPFDDGLKEEITYFKGLQ